jgi:hypothetical protein
MSVLSLIGVGVLLQDNGHDFLGPAFIWLGAICFAIWLVFTLIASATR